MPLAAGIRSKREPGHPVQCYNYLSPNGLCAHTTPVKTEDSKTWDQFQSGLLVPGRREGRAQGSFLTFWSNAHNLQEPVWTPISSQLVNLPRLMKQFWPSATLHTAAWIENLTRPLIYWQHLTTQHIATSPEPVPQCKQIGAGWASSRPHGSLLCMPWASLRICTAPCRVLLASSWEYFIFQDPGFPRYKFKFLAKLYISLYYINERCTGTFSWYTTYCSQVVHHCLSKEKASTTKFCQFQGENEEPFSKGFTPDSHCSLSKSFGPHTLLIQHHLGNSLLKLHAHYHEWELWGLAHHSETP